MTSITTAPLNDTFVREILLCDTVLQCETECLIAIPLPRAVQCDEHLGFKALYLSLDTNVVLGAEVVNCKASGMLDSFSDGLFICQVTRYAIRNNMTYAIVSIHCNQTISYESQSANNRREAVFAFRYWIDKINR